VHRETATKGELDHGRLVAQSFYTVMAIVIFAATYIIAACVYLMVLGLAVDDRARAFKAVSPGMLPPLGIIFGLPVGFVAVQVWNDFDKAKLAVATEASALRAVVLLDGSLRLTLATLPTAPVEALQLTVSLKPQDEAQRTAQREIVAALHRALDARRQRIIVSQSNVSPVKWAAILLQGLCALIAIAMVHRDSRLACAKAVTIFATGIALSALMIAAYTRPFTGELSVGPELLQQVIPDETATSQPNSH
jgi:hypothetical protein